MIRSPHASTTEAGDRVLWATPAALFERWNRLFRFGLDACAVPGTSKASWFCCPPGVWDELEWQAFAPGIKRDGQSLALRDGLASSWHAPIPDDLAMAYRQGPPAVWLNPPYGREIAAWLEKAREEASRGCVVVALIPVDPSTRWWHRNVQGQADVHYLRRRVKFEGRQGRTTACNFASAIAIYWPEGLFDA